MLSGNIDDSDHSFAAGTSLRILRQKISLFEDDDEINIENLYEGDVEEDEHQLLTSAPALNEPSAEEALFVKAPNDFREDVTDLEVSSQGAACPENNMKVEDVELTQQYESGDSMYDDPDDNENGKTPSVAPSVDNHGETEENLDCNDNASENTDNQDVQTGIVVEENSVSESDELALKRRLIEEKRQKLMELEEAYLEEFGDEENMDDVDDLEAEATVVAEDKEAVEKDDKNVSVELIYDSVLACYFDPSTGRYYEIQQES